MPDVCRDAVSRGGCASALSVLRATLPPPPLPPPAEAEAPAELVGKRGVLIEGLTGRKELNGRCGTVLAYDGASDRYIARSAACSLAAERVRSLGAISGSLSPFVFFSSIPYLSRYSRDAPNGRVAGAGTRARRGIRVWAFPPEPRRPARAGAGGTASARRRASNCRISNW